MVVAIHYLASRNINFDMDHHWISIFCNYYEIWCKKIFMVTELCPRKHDCYRVEFVSNS